MATLKWYSLRCDRCGHDFDGEDSRFLGAVLVRAQEAGWHVSLPRGHDFDVCKTCVDQMDAKRRVDPLNPTMKLSRGEWVH